MATKAASANTPVQPQPKKSRLLAMIIALVIVLAGAGGAAWYFMGSKASSNTEKAQAKNLAPPVFIPMEAFTVNLQSEHGEQFLQTGFTLQVKSQDAVDLIKLYMPHVRSRILLLLTSKKASDILSSEGKDKLSKEIINSIKKPFTPNGPSVEVTSVLFTSFVVQ